MQTTRGSHPSSQTAFPSHGGSYISNYKPQYFIDWNQCILPARALNVLLLVATALHCFTFYPKLRGTISCVISSAAYCFMAIGYGKVYGGATSVLLLLYCALAESEF